MGRTILLHVLGVVLVVIFRIRTSLPTTLVGVRRKSILDRYPGCRLTRVARLAQDPVKDAPILVIRPVMLVRVPLVVPWGPHRIASVA